MGAMKANKRVDRLLVALSEGDQRARCAALRTLCPCRGGVRDLGVWRKIFERARCGGQRERVQAAHAIGTLTEKASQGSLAWRRLLQALREDLDELMRDPRAASACLAQVKRNCNQSERRGTALRKLRRRRRALELATAEELAAWVNARFRRAGSVRVGPEHPGVQRLWRWMRHRIRFQPTRGTKESELVERARRYLPQTALQ